MCIRDRYREIGLTQVRSEEDFYKIPFSSKEEEM